jgi:hypothetical protein
MYHPSVETLPLGYIFDLAARLRIMQNLLDLRSLKGQEYASNKKTAAIGAVQYCMLRARSIYAKQSTVIFISALQARIRSSLFTTSVIASGKEADSRALHRSGELAPPALARYVGVGVSSHVSLGAAEKGGPVLYAKRRVWQTIPLRKLPISMKAAR